MGASMSLIQVFLLLAARVAAPQTRGPDAWASWRFLVGRWAAEGHGEPGEGKGAFEFRLELQGHILMRRSRLDFPAPPGREAFSHEDLLIVYPAQGTDLHRAIYFDSEGHVIQYTAAFGEQEKELTFLSEASPGAPRQRLTYYPGEKGTLRVKFEIAPPGKPEVFVTHMEGIAHPEGR